MYDDTLSKKENENDFEYHKRLIYGKLKDKTLADYDYAELSEPAYGKQYTADETRKRMYGSLKTLEILDDLSISNITDEAILSEIDSKKLDLQKEKQRFFDQRREFNKLVNEEGRWEHLESMLSESASKLTESVGIIMREPDYKPVEFSDNEAVLVLGDWHYGMVTDNLFNEFNVDICKMRVRSLLEMSIDRLVLHKVKTLRIILLGDFIHGGIHVSTRVASEELVCDQLMQVSEIIAQFILSISKVVDETFVYGTYGNHARIIQNKKDNIHNDNMERIIPWWLEQRITAEEAARGESLNITIDRSNWHEFVCFDSNGFTFCAAHGDLDTTRTAPKTLGTLFSKMCGKDIDYIILGDKHHEEAFEELGIESFLCGSLCGTDEYANIKRLYSDPSQLLLIVSSIDGVDARYKLKLFSYF